MMSTDRRQGWLRELVVGDSVIISNHRIGGMDTYDIAKVVKISETGQITAGQCRFMSDGRVIGGGNFPTRRLYKYTEEFMKKIKYANELHMMRLKFEREKWDLWGYDDLKILYDVYQERKNGKKNDTANTV